MSAVYDAAISRASSGSDPLVPEPVAAEIIQDITRASAVLSNARILSMGTKTFRLPVLSALPEAYWVDGDTGLKQTSKQEWENKTLIAEELAAIVPVPIAYVDDSQFDIWSEVRPRVAEVIGAKLDRAALFGESAPATWTDELVGDAVTAGNVVVEGTGDDLAADVAAASGLVAEDGFSVNGYVSAPGFRWKLIGLRSSDGHPIYAPPATGQPGTLFGFPLGETLNGGFDTSEATLIAGDWTKAIVGIRQDVRYEVFREGVISDADGKIILNLMQQDSVALRVTARFGFVVANPENRVNQSATDRYPFSVITPSGS